MEEKKILCSAEPRTGKVEDGGFATININQDGNLTPPADITPAQAALIHKTLATNVEEKSEEELRKELEAEGDTGIVKVNINPLTGEQEGEPELNDEDLNAILYAAAGGRQAFPESYKLILVDMLGMTQEEINEFEKVIVALDNTKPMREQISEEDVNKYIADTTVVPKDGETIMDAKYTYIESLKQICMFDIDNMDMGEMFEKALLATQEKYGIAAHQLADNAKEKVAERIAKLEATGKNKYLINSLKAKQKVLNTEFSLDSVDSLLDGRAKYLARDYMSNKSLKKEIVKFEQLVYNSNIKLDSLEYFSAALDCVVANTTHERLTMFQIRKFLYMLIRSATTRTSEAPMVIATVGWFIKVLYKNTHEITTVRKEDAKAEIPQHVKEFGISLYVLVTRYAK